MKYYFLYSVILSLYYINSPHITTIFFMEITPICNIRITISLIYHDFFPNIIEKFLSKKYKNNGDLYPVRKGSLRISLAIDE